MGPLIEGKTAMSPTTHQTADTTIIGGGFFGSMIACHLAAKGQRVILLERGENLLERASHNNQARVHQGYHYPRSLITGLRSRENYTRFVAEFGDCVHRGFDKYYAIGREFSKVNAAQFELFCKRIGAPLSEAPIQVKALFDRGLIEEVFRVEEAAFDARKLTAMVWNRLEKSNILVWTKSEATRVEHSAGGIRVTANRLGRTVAIQSNQVFNCTYGDLNGILRASDLPLIPLKHELAELALVQPPPILAKLGITIMCGPFFSLMPFPSTPWHSFSHVRYTPHAGWNENTADDMSPQEARAMGEPVSRVEMMRLDALRYMPDVAAIIPKKSLFEINTDLPVNEKDDGRPILFRRDCGLPGLHCVLGAKLDNIHDILDEIDNAGALAARHAA
jgi:glycine/D-amino acid oxidase-like deaminating enzyme